MDDILKKLDSIISGKPITKAPPTKGGAPSVSYDEIFDEAGKEYGVDPNLLRGMTSQESAFKRNALSPKGASGLMQLMPDTAEYLGVKDIWDPRQNIFGGAKYIREQLDAFNGDVSLALAAYNAGPGAVKRYGKIPPFKETQDYVKRITANYQGTGRLNQAPTVDIFSKLDSIMGTAPAAAPSQDILGKLDSIIGGTGLGPTNPTGAYTPVDPSTSVIPHVGIPAYQAPVSTTQVVSPSIPSERPVLKPRDDRKLAPPVKQPTPPLGEGSVSVDVGGFTPIDPEAGQLVDTGVQVDMPVQRGKGTDRNGVAANVTVNLGGVPTAEKLDYSLRKAYQAVAGKFDLSPEQIEKGIQLHRDNKMVGAVDDNTVEGTIEITLKDIENIKGQAVAREDERMRQSMSRVGIEEIPTDSLLTPELIQKIDASTAGLLETPLVGFEDYQNTAAGLLRSGGSAWRALAGLYRTADELIHRPFGDGTNRFINSQKPEDVKVYKGDDIYQYMTSVAEPTEAIADKLAKRGGTRAEIFQMAGALPGDLSRIMLLSRLPGGIVTGMSADMASQAAGRGESYDKVAAEAFKGALFGSIARLATPVGKGIAENTGSRIAGGAGALAFTGAATYPVSRAFGADEKAALKETIFNTIFGFADALPVLAGRTIRAKDAAGNEVAVKVEESGEVVEVQLPKDQPADIEVMDPSFQKYEDQRQQATTNLYKENSRPRVDRLNGAEFTVEKGGDVIAANPAAISILNDVFKVSAKASDFSGFHGAPLSRGDVGVFTKHLENMRDDAPPAEAAAYNAFIAKLNETGKRMSSDAALYTDYKDLPEYTQGTRGEELAHVMNRRAGIQEAEGALSELPGVSKLIGNLDEVYSDRTSAIKLDEAVAQSFRPDAESHLKLNKQEIRRAHQELYRALAEVEDFDVNKYAESLRGVSRRGEVLARYAKQKQRSGVSSERGLADVGRGADQIDPSVRGLQEPPGPGTRDSSGYPGRDTSGDPQRGDVQAGTPEEVGVGDFVLSKHALDDPSNYQLVHEVRDGYATLSNAFDAGEGAQVRVPIKDLQVAQKRPQEELSGRVDEVDIIEDPSKEQGMFKDPVMAQLWQGSRHRFKPEVKVRNKQTGEEKFIEAEKVQDFPPGTRVSRRGDNLIIRKPGYYNTKAARELIKADEWLPEIPEGFEVVEKFPLGRLRDDKINTGEGAQIRGYGHYAAEKRGVASHYREAGARDNVEPVFMYDGKEFDYQSTARGMSDAESLHHNAVMGTFTAMDNNRVDAEEAIQNEIDWLETEIARFEKADQAGQSTPQMAELSTYYKKLVEAHRQLDPAKFDIEVGDPHPGYLYRAKSNVPDEQMLILDARLKDQSYTVQEVADRYRQENFGDDRVSRDITGERFYDIVKNQLRQYSGTRRPDVEASEYLNELGLKGMKFLDQDSRYGKRKVTYQGKEPSLSLHRFPSTDEQVSFKEVIDQIDRNEKTPEQAINNLISKYETELEMYAPGEAPARFVNAIQALKTLNPKDFKVDGGSYNHILFSGEDAEVRRVLFAQVFKDNKIFDAKAQNEVMQFADESFPEVFSLLRRKSTGKPLVTNPIPVAAERVQAARGMDESSFFQRRLDNVVGIYKEFKRQFKEIDPNENVQMARTADSFRLLSSLNNWAKVQGTNDVARITKPLSREQFDVFENVLILRDKQQAVEQGMKPGHGYADLKEVESALAVYEKAAMSDPAIAKALGDREALRRSTVQKLVDLDMLGQEALDNTRYFHRQVPQGETNLWVSLGSKDVRVKQKGFEKKRSGEGDDYNTNYVESEVEWLSQAHAQIRKSELLTEIDRAVNVADDLKLQGKIQGVDWKTLIDSDHRVWQPKEGSYFFKVMAAPDQLLNDIFAGKHTLGSAQSQIKELMARGQRKPEWVLPKQVAALMDDFEVQHQEGALKRATATAMSTWKQWMLINPKNYLSYNLRNLLSDSFAVEVYPGIAKELPAAIKDIWKYSRDKNHASAAEIEQAIKDGVMDSGQTFAEIPDISKSGALSVFGDSDTNILTKSMTKVWDAMKNTTNARENWIRLAAYRHIKQKLDAGETIYGASTAGQVDAMISNGRKAAKIARELVGDYGGVSEGGRQVRKHAMPFYSWMEINAPRYVRVIKNLPLEEGAKTKLLGTAAGRTVRVLYSGGKLAAKLVAITAGINAWNHLMFPDLEDQLSKTDMGKRPHLIVGTNPDGTARVFQADTALRDALDWFDIGDVGSDIQALTDGRKTAGDQAAEAVKAPVNRMVQALGPVKTAGELVMGRSTYPNIFEKGTSFALQNRPIRDRVEHLAQALAVKGIYQRVMGRPTPPSSGPVGQLSDWFLTMRVDPEESIFWNVRGRVSDYKKKQGKSSGGVDPTEKSNTLFYYKQAIRWNNPMAAERYLKEYKEEFGGTDAGLKSSLDRTHPLGGLAKSDWPEFIKQLTPDERDQLKVAIGYYDETFKQKEKATPAVDTTVEELMQMAFPGKSMEDVDRMVEKDRRQDATKVRQEENRKARGLESPK